MALNSFNRSDFVGQVMEGSSGSEEEDEEEEKDEEPTKEKEMDENSIRYVAHVP